MLLNAPVQTAEGDTAVLCTASGNRVDGLVTAISPRGLVNGVCPVVSSGVF